MTQVSRHDRQSLRLKLTAVQIMSFSRPWLYFLEYKWWLMGTPSFSTVPSVQTQHIAHSTLDRLYYLPMMRSSLMFRCNDLTVPYPTGAISLVDPFVDHQHQPLNLEIDEDSCIDPDHPLHPDRSPCTPTSTSTRPSTSTSTSAPHGTTSRSRSKYRNGIESARTPHRFPPIFYLPLPWPFNYVSPAVHPRISM